MEFKHLRNIGLFLSLTAIFYACSTSEDTVVVVEDAPSTEETAEPDTVDEQFTELTIGLIDSVTNFDPLFAENLSTQRTLSLIYEGLYTLDRDGNPIPAIASSVEISDDSLEYVFILNQNKYFHNSSVFTAGVGRRVNATDVKHTFERTAKATVPNHASDLLMNVAGFENYFLEQRSIYDSEKRVLEGISGIQAVNSQTVAIILDEKDPQFLRKLASPYLFVYPQEAVSGDNSLSDNPVGTGPYQLTSQDNNGQIVLSRNERRSRSNSNGQTQIQQSLINRINLRQHSEETQLFQDFSNGRTDWIPEIGPDISREAINESGNLRDSYEENAHLVKNNADRITALYLNDRATVNHDWLINRLAYLTEEDIRTRGDLTLNVDNFEITEDAQPNEQYFASYTEDAITRSLLTELHNIIFVPESSLVMFDIRVPTKQTSVYTRNSSSLHDTLAPLDDHYWMRLDTQILGLHHNRVSGIEPTSVPWHLHIEQIRVRNSQAGSE